MPLKTVSENERRAIFTQVASEIGIRPDMIEKDYWVSWVLNKIFEHEKLKTILLFKHSDIGGSKKGNNARIVNLSLILMIMDARNAGVKMLPIVFL